MPHDRLEYQKSHVGWLARTSAKAELTSWELVALLTVGGLILICIVAGQWLLPLIWPSFFD